MVNCHFWTGDRSNGSELPHGACNESMPWASGTQWELCLSLPKESIGLESQTLLALFTDPTTYNKWRRYIHRGLNLQFSSLGPNTTASPSLAYHLRFCRNCRASRSLQGTVSPYEFSCLLVVLNYLLQSRVLWQNDPKMLLELVGLRLSCCDYFCYSTRIQI